MSDVVLTEEPPVRDGPVRDGVFEHHADGKVFIVLSESERYELPPLDLAKDRPEIERYYVEHCHTPVAAIAKEMDALKDLPELRKEFLDRAYADIQRKGELIVPDVDEVRTFLNTQPGIIFTYYLMLRKKYPQVTLDKTREICERAGQQMLLEARDKASKRAIERYATR
jgi:hypothetical protein